MCVGTCGGQRLQIPLELELCAVVNPLTWVQGIEQAEPSLQPGRLCCEDTSLFPKGSTLVTSSRSRLLTPSHKMGLGFQHLNFRADANIWFLTKSLIEIVRLPETQQLLSFKFICCLIHIISSSFPFSLKLMQVEVGILQIKQQHQQKPETKTHKEVVLTSHSSGAQLCPVNCLGLGQHTNSTCGCKPETGDTGMGH